MLRKLLILIPFVAVITRWVLSRTIKISAQCDLESDHTKLGRCLRPWLDLWEMIRVKEIHAANLVYPVPFYTRESVLFLCSAYFDSQSTCMTSEILEKCKRNEMIIFIQRHMRYYCGDRAKIVFGKFDCLRSALMSNQHCWRHIQDISSPTYRPSKCIGIPKFVNCMLPDVRSKCKNSGAHVFVDAITSFECALEKELVQQSAKYIARINATGEFTEKVGRKYILNELPAALPVLDEEGNARPSIQKYLTVENNIANFFSTPPASFPTNGGQRSLNANKTFERSNEINSTDGLFSSSDSKTKQTFHYRRASARKINPNLDYVEETTLLESDPAIELALNNDENVLSISKTKSLKCTMKQEEEIAQCYAPMIELWNKIQNRHRSSDNILLPIFNYHLKELSDLCDLLDAIFDSCFTTSLINDCQGNSTEAMQECTDIIRNNNTTRIIHCDQMINFFNCLLDTIQQKCTLETHSFFADIITNFGCATPLIYYKSDMKATITEKMKNDVSSEKQKMNPSIESEIHPVKILDGELFSYQLSTKCTEEMQMKTRMCVHPLLISWNNLRQQKPMLKNVSFPMYKYTSQELLELCDGYANVFQCAGSELITICLNEEMVRFTRDHFGYICTTQNIKRFMKHYECIVEVATAYSKKCQMFITGVAGPGKDLKKCRGIRQYYNCMKPEIIRECRSEALKEFETSIIEYGCDLSLHDSAHL
ncbi:hypothetical protein X798_03532 [Onchocerca flexuosa]|uniref:DUF19 domain-containing protein n=1 Tax=Onchocerca flexuosa TaxID=387005 RepID=A0A238BVS8_9BILA|nr:hypothetical protein X798_03532 [Onchocerca flexuosa]